MNILQILNSGNPGGVEQQVLDLVKGFTKKGNSVFVSCKDGDIVDWYKSAGATVQTDTINFEIDLGYILRLAKFMRVHKIEIIHAHELKAGINGILAALLAGVKVRVSHIHTPMSEWRVPGAAKKVYTQLENILYSQFVNLFSSAEIALTPSRKAIKVKEGIRESKLRVIPNGIDIARFYVDTKLAKTYNQEIRRRYNIEDTAYVFGIVGRLTEEKGHGDLINAFAEWLKSGDHASPIYLLIVGGGKLESLYKTQIDALGLNSKIIITGVFSAEDCVKFYCTFDSFVFSSLAEGFGYVLVEAMYAGLPILSSDLPVLKEVGANTISYFSTRDITSLKNGLDELYKGSMHGYGSNIVAKKRVESLYTVDAFVDSYLDLYKNLYTMSL